MKLSTFFLYMACFQGTSYTLCTLNDVSVAGDLIDVLKEANQTIPMDLHDLASGRRTAKLARRFISVSSG